MVTQWLIVLAAMLLVGLALDAMRQRERALRMARHLCERRGMQLLDQTVGLSGLRLRRADDGMLHLERRYGFEVSLDGDDRHPGHLWIVAGRLCGSALPQSAEDRAAQEATVPRTTGGASPVIDLESHRRRRQLH